MKTALQTLLVLSISITLAACSGGGSAPHHQSASLRDSDPHHGGKVGPKADGGVSEPAHSPVSGAPAGSGKLLVKYEKLSDQTVHPTQYRIQGPTGAWTAWTNLKSCCEPNGITKTAYTYPIEFRRTTSSPPDRPPRMPSGVKVENQKLTTLLIYYY